MRETLLKTTYSKSIHLILLLFFGISRISMTISIYLFLLLLISFIYLHFGNYLFVYPNICLYLCTLHTLFKTPFFQGGRAHWAVYYTCPQSFIIKFSLFVGLATLEAFIVYRMVGSLSWVFRVSTTNCNLQKW